MDTEEYKQAVVDMYAAMQSVFQANETLRVAAERVWTWDRSLHNETLPSIVAAAPSPLLPPSPPSEPQEDEEAEDKPCDCEQIPWKACPHECSLCLKKLCIHHDGERLCWRCEEDLVTVTKDYPEDAAKAKQNSVYAEGAYHALVLRIRANNLREEADDTDEAEEVRDCLQHAESLDEIASHLLYEKADYTFKPWWFKRWDYWMQPGSSYNGDKTWAGWRFPDGKTVPEATAVAEVEPECPLKDLLREHEEPEICGDSTIVKVATDLEAVAEKAKRPNYNHPRWPSPRPKLFAKACAFGSNIKKHEEALEYLAQRANISVEALLEMNPETYAEKYMGGKMYAPYYAGTSRRTGWSYA